jgi:hypothetical protein
MPICVASLPYISFISLLASLYRYISFISPLASLCFYISLFLKQSICFASLPYISFINLLASLHCYISVLQVHLFRFAAIYLIYKSTGFAALLYISFTSLLDCFASLYLYFFISLASLCYFTDFICNYFTLLILPAVKLLASLSGANLICIPYFHLSRSWVHEWWYCCMYT